MSRNLPLVHAPVPNPLLRFSMLVNRPQAPPDVATGFGDWSGLQFFSSLPGDWPADDPTLAGGPPAGGSWLRGQGTYTGVDPNLIVTPRVTTSGATLVWEAIWLYDASAPALPSACPSPVCPPCPGNVTPPVASSSSSSGTVAAILGGVVVVGGALALAAR